jgi:type I restriction enzyme R subunit
VTIDWAEREDVRAHLRRLVKRVLRKHGYPPDKQEKATQTVLEQAALLSAEVGNGMRGASNNGMQRTASRRRRTGAFATSDTSTQSKSTEPDHAGKPCRQALCAVLRLDTI